MMMMRDPEWVCCLVGWSITDRQILTKKEKEKLKKEKEKVRHMDKV